mgnify:CR=1 FL=1|tara:strand:- start:371 stop:1684 length:1314 start_codon:yes stop_codon:yes gene_type:complete
MSWTESDAAHKLIRSKNKKQRDMARKSSIKSKASRMTQKDAEMTPDIMDYPGLPVVPDSYGTNSALESGQGVPQWYGSAESFDDIKTASDLVEFAESNGGSLHIEIADSLARYSEYISFVEPNAEAMDFVFLDGTMATCNKDDDLNTFVVAYEGDEGETFEAMASHDPSGDDRDDAKAQFKMTYPGFTMSNSSLQYLIYQSGSSNKYHMFWLAQDKSGGWYAFNGYGRIGYSARIHRITGPTAQEMAMRAMQSKINKKVSEGYTNVSRDFDMNAEESGNMMTFGEISYQYEYEDPSDGPLDYYDVQSIQRAVEGYITDSGKSQGEGEFAHYASENDIVISVSWTHKYSGINSAEEVQAGLPVIPDSYGTNSALSSGQGVPQWYGSADTEDENWDRTEYEYKELEIAKPFRTAFMASLGFVVAPLALLAGLAFAFGDE